MPKTVWHTMRCTDGVVRHCISDLIFIENTPFVVLEWSAVAGQEIPLVTVELDPQFLQIGPSAGAEALYQVQIEDPRRAK